MNYLYRHIRPDTNQVFYIGIGRQNRRRPWEERSRNQLWKNIVLKNQGKFDVEIILSDLDDDTAEQKEKEFISLYGKISEGTGTLANFQNGGRDTRGVKASQETKDKMSLARKNVNPPNIGKKWSDETKRKMSLSHMGNKSTKGKIWINNNDDRTLINKTDLVPDGWSKGKGKTKKIKV